MNGLYWMHNFVEILYRKLHNLFIFCVNQPEHSLIMNGLYWMHNFVEILYRKLHNLFIFCVNQPDRFFKIGLSDLFPCKH